MDPDAARRMVTDMLAQAWADLEHPERQVAARRWLEGWHAPLPAATAAELVGLDVDAIRSRMKNKMG
jgi:hypothetical protein